MNDLICEAFNRYPVPQYLHPLAVFVSFVIYFTAGYMTGRYVINRTLGAIIIFLLNYLFKRSSKTEQQQNKES